MRKDKPNKKNLKKRGIEKKEGKRAKTVLPIKMID